MSNAISLADWHLWFGSNRVAFKGSLYIDTKPSLDFTIIRDFFGATFQPTIIKELRKNLIEIFMKIHEMERVEEAKDRFGITSDPWDKYLLLDSNFFLKLMNHDSVLNVGDQVAFLRFVVYTIEHELAPMIKIDMKSARQEFFNFLKMTNLPRMFRIRNASEEITSPEEIASTFDYLDTTINAPFYEYMKQQGNMKPHKEDYEDLMQGSTGAELSKLKKPDTEPQTPKLKIF